MRLQTSTEFAIQQLLQSVFTVSVLGEQKDIDILEQLIKDTESHEVLADDDKVLVPIFRALIAEIDRKTKKYASYYAAKIKLLEQKN
jgi:hypothetical protein